MRNCRACQRHIPDDARTCPFCGTQVIEETITCPSCGEETDLHADVCANCGFRFVKKKKASGDGAKNLFADSLENESEQSIADRFSIAFERRLVEEHKAALHNAYIDRFYQSDFKDSVQHRIRLLAEQIHRTETDKGENAALINKAIEELLDYFIIRYCEDLNEAYFSEKILRWQSAPAKEIDLGAMISDYLNLEQENETYFVNLVTMPAPKLKNAAQSFLFPKKGEPIYLICDLSMLGSCKEGFAMTRDCIYWKMPFEKKQRVYYKNLKTIKRQEDWIVINGIFFSANKSLNLKLLRLLKKLKELFGKK